jgi:hypothetical protein
VALPEVTSTNSEARFGSRLTIPVAPWSPIAYKKNEGTENKNYAHATAAAKNLSLQQSHSYSNKKKTSPSKNSPHFGLNTRNIIKTAEASTRDRIRGKIQHLPSNAASNASSPLGYPKDPICFALLGRDWQQTAGRCTHGIAPSPSELSLR